MHLNCFPFVQLLLLTKFFTRSYFKPCAYLQGCLFLQSGQVSDACSVFPYPCWIFSLARILLVTPCSTTLAAELSAVNYHKLTKQCSHFLSHTNCMTCGTTGNVYSDFLTCSNLLLVLCQWKYAIGFCPTKCHTMTPFPIT